MKYTTLTICNTDFVCTEAAAEVLEQFLDKAGWRLLGQKTRYQQLARALRELLLQYQQLVPGATVGKAMAEKAVATVGVPVPFWPLTGASSEPKMARPFRGMKTLWRANREARRVPREGLLRGAAFILLALALMHAVLAVRLYVGAAAHSQLAESSMGTVLFGLSAAEKRTLALLYLAAFGLFGLLAFLVHRLARPSKRLWKYLLGIVVTTLALVGVYSVLQHNAAQRAPTTHGALAKLLVCGDSIRFDADMFNQASAVFYALYDKGYRLRAELPNQTGQQSPSKETLCTAYRKIRQTTPPNNIVLLQYDKDDTGTPIPHDPMSIGNSGAQFGLFVRR